MNDYIGSGGYNSSNKNDNTNTKKWMKIIGVLLFFLLLAIIVIICLMYYVDTTELKISIDNKPADKLKSQLIFEGEKVYIPIRSFSGLVGYDSFKGDYREEYDDQVYVKNAYEEAYFNKNSKTIYKKLLNGEDDFEYYEIQDEVKMINSQLYTTIEGAQIAFNILMSYTNNQISIFTLPYLVTYYSGQNTTAAISDKDADFSNQKALLYNMIIVKNANNFFGVSTLEGKEVLGTKYKNVKFTESTKEFIVTTVENKMGIMSYDPMQYTAITKILPEYDSIKQIDKNNGLYLVTNDKKQGVINNTGSGIVYLEYDQIGVDKSKFGDIKNTYLLYDKCIPVKLNNKWGLIDITGKKVLDVKYDDLGCVVNAGSINENNVNSVLLVPKYEGIVVKEGKSYGLVHSSGAEFLPSVLTTVYSTTSEGVTTYKLIHNNQIVNVIQYLEDTHFKQIDYKGPYSKTINNTLNTNTQPNTNTNTQTNNYTNTTENTQPNTNVQENTQNSDVTTNTNQNYNSTVQTNGNVVDNTQNNNTVQQNENYVNNSLLSNDSNSY